jgi:hypothetical protein
MEIAAKRGDFNPFDHLGEELITGVRRVLFLTGFNDAPISPSQEIVDEVSGPKATQRVAVLGREVAKDDKPACRVQLP